MKRKIQKKNQKPIEIDAQFRFKCPDVNCGYDYWLSLKQCQTKNFKIVCDCGIVFKPKKIVKIKILYSKNTNPKTQKTVNENNKQSSQILKKEPNRIEITSSYRDIIVKKLEKYGFTESECVSLATKAYSINPVNSQSDFIKYILENITILENNNEYSKETVVI